VSEDKTCRVECCASVPMPRILLDRAGRELMKVPVLTLSTPHRVASTIPSCEICRLGLGHSMPFLLLLSALPLASYQFLYYADPRLLANADGTDGPWLKSISRIRLQLKLPCEDDQLVGERVQAQESRRQTKRSDFHQRSPTTKKHESGGSE